MKPLYLAYSLLAYALFAVALIWAVLFLTWPGGPLVDRGPMAPAAAALAIDLLLLALFAAQHTVMARPAFKRRLTRVVPAGAERSSFVLAASAVLLLLFWQWRPLPAVVWSLPGALGYGLLWAGVAGWLLLVAATFMIDHFDLFGLRQGWLAARGRGYAQPPFQTRWLYGWIRHPIMTGFLVIFWAVPRMTLGHLVFSAAASGYIAVGIWFEERDLLRAVPEYADYRRRVGAILPRAGRGGLRPGSRELPEAG
jgi:methanethiol S-methyltransferase